MVPGSFDPMTVAHAALAEALLSRAGAVYLVASSRTLPKEPGPGGEAGSPLLSPEDRVASLLAFAEHRSGIAVALCSHGLYADQADAAVDRFPGAEVVFGVGSDKVRQLFDPSWYEDRDAALDRLFRRARVAYAVRAGEEPAVRRVLAEHPRWAERLERLRLPTEAASVAARRVREALRRGESADDLVPREVLPFAVRAASR